MLVTLDLESDCCNWFLYNDLKELNCLIDKWQRVSQEAAGRLLEKTQLDPKPTMSQLLTNLQVDKGIIHFSEEDEAFYWYWKVGIWTSKMTCLHDDLLFCCCPFGFFFLTTVTLYWNIRSGLKMSLCQTQKRSQRCNNECNYLPEHILVKLWSSFNDN